MREIFLLLTTGRRTELPAYFRCAIRYPVLPAPCHSFPMRAYLLPFLLSLLCSGCAVVTVAGAAVSVVATGVKVGATVVGTTVDVAAAGVRAVVGSSDEKK